MQAQRILAVLVITSLMAGCADTPHIQTADPEELFDSEFSFIQDGQTRREEALLRLGLPSAQFEGDRILIYQLRVDNDGVWHIVAPQVQALNMLRWWPPGVYSLVLVFGKEGILQKHSLVVAR